MELISHEQSAIPMFESLFLSALEEILIYLLFELATWHALAKLRLHTELTIVALEHSTQHLGEAIRVFEGKLHAEYTAGELPGDDVLRAKGKAKAVSWNMDQVKENAGTAPRAKGKVKIDQVKESIDSNTSALAGPC